MSEMNKNEALLPVENEKEMFEYAKNLDFEKAAAVRDKLAELKSRVLGAGVPTET